MHQTLQMKTEYTIIVDTKERKPLWNSGIINKHLDIGDYSFKCEGIDYSDKICLERKSGTDFFSTMLSGNKRFHKEIERAKKLDYFALIIETNYTNILNKEFEGAHYSKVKGFIPLQIAFTFHIKHHINLFFCNGRIETKKIIKELFNAYWKTNNK